jgi:hypothetical protein
LVTVTVAVATVTVTVETLTALTTEETAATALLALEDTVATGGLDAGELAAEDPATGGITVDAFEGVAAADDATETTGLAELPPTDAFLQSEPEHFLYNDSARDPPQYSELSPLHFMLQLPKIPSLGARSAASVLPHQHLKRYS